MRRGDEWTHLASVIKNDTWDVDANNEPHLEAEMFYAKFNPDGTVVDGWSHERWTLDRIPNPAKPRVVTRDIRPWQSFDSWTARCDDVRSGQAY